MKYRRLPGCKAYEIQRRAQDDEKSCYILETIVSSLHNRMSEERQVSRAGV
jgi:hypothetical protein